MQKNLIDVKLKPEKEKDFQKKVNNYIRGNGHFLIKYQAGQFTMSGIPDLICCIHGKFVAIEIKSGSKTTLAQEEQMRRIREWGKGIAFTLENDITWKRKLDQIFERCK